MSVGRSLNGRHGGPQHGGLREEGAGGFAAIEHIPRLVYQNDLTTMHPHFHWSADVGFSLWLRSYVDTVRRSGEGAPLSAAQP